MHYHYNLYLRFSSLFTPDKARDLASMTEKLRLELQTAHRKQDDLSEEIRLLKVLEL